MFSLSFFGAGVDIRVVDIDRVGTENDDEDDGADQSNDGAEAEITSNGENEGGIEVGCKAETGEEIDEFLFAFGVHWYKTSFRFLSTTLASFEEMLRGLYIGSTSTLPTPYLSGIQGCNPPFSVELLCCYSLSGPREYGEVGGE